MRDDFAAFILTHGRPDRVLTYKTLRKCGYTGKIYLLIDDEDKCGDEYRKLYGDQVICFSKQEIAERFDEGDNFQDRRSIFYARNASFGIAEVLGLRYFIQLDDDYTEFRYRFTPDLMPGFIAVRSTMNGLFGAMVDFYEDTGAIAVAISQGGDWIGGAEGVPTPRLRRKAMNSFVCRVDRPLRFVGRVNEDVNTYTSEGQRGHLFLTAFHASLNQKQTQSNAGGMTEMYLDSGTYLKSFYSVLYSPSCVKIGAMSDNQNPGNSRFHHEIDWPRTVPCILREEHRKGGPR